MSPVQLETIMDRHGFTQESLAKTLGVTKQAVGHWVCGRRTVPETAARLVRMFDQQPQFIRYFESFKTE